MEKKTLKANVRKSISKHDVNQLRNNKRIPGIFYMKTVASVPVEVFENDLNPLVFTAENHILDLQLDDNRQFDCIVKDIQFHPVTGKVLHFDLQGLVTGEKVKMEIPVQLTGVPVGQKDGGQVQELLHKISVECLPIDIPEHIVLDITPLKLNHSIHIRDLKYENLTFLHPEDAVIVTVSLPRGMQAAEATSEDGGAKEPEVIAKGKEKNEN